MGGLGSGNWSRWPTKSVVGNGLTLDLYKLIRDGAFSPGQVTSGTLTWTRNGEYIGSIGYNSDLTNPSSGSVHLHYNHEDKPVDYRVSLETTRPYFGGLRWWFVCPVNGTRAAKLHLPSGSNIFASRQAFDLAYRSQNETASDRLLTKAQDIRRNLGGSASLMEPFPAKPKGMHWTTYWRLRDQSELAANRALAGMAKRLGGRNRGDWEAHSSGIYKEINYFELYLLGVLERNRRAIHIYNRFDNCCYNGVLTSAFSAQLEGIARRWQLGKLKFRIDEKAHGHVISSESIHFILKDIFDH